MRLLTPNQTKDLQSEEQVLKILRTQETEEAAKRANMGLARAEADFAATLARNREIWEQEEKEHAKRKKEMAQEVLELEEKRSQALIPVSLLQDKADKKMREAEEFSKELKVREDGIEEIKDILEDRLDEVGEREVAADKREKSLDLRTQGIERQSKMISEGAVNLTQRISDFEVKKAEEERELSERKTALFLRERSVTAKEESQKRTAKSLQDWETQLKDERGTLNRAWAELEHKKKA